MFFRNRAFYPFLFGFFIVFSLVIINPSIIRPVEIIRPLVLVESIAAISFIILNQRLQDQHRAGYFTLLILVYLFFFGYFFREAQTWDFLGSGFSRGLMAFALWTIPFLVLGISAFTRKGDSIQRIKFTQVLNIGSLILLSISLVALVTNSPGRFVLALNTPEAKANLDPGLGDSPDIFYILLDGYGREDVLKELYAYDNSQFIDFLEEKGFYIAPQSLANYFMTLQSLSSTLNMAYLPELGIPKTDTVTSDRVPLEQLIHQSKVREIVESKGYQFVAYDSGFAHTQLRDADIYLSDYFPLSPHEEILLSNSPLAILDGYVETRIPMYGYPTHRAKIRSIFDKIELAASLPGPKFVFAHIMAPHPPFVFDQDGNPLEPPVYYTLRDGDNFLGSREEYMRGYKDQISFVTREIKDAVEMVLSDPNSEPLIIIQGDHGPGAYFSFHSTEGICYWERAGILNAFHLPDEIGTKLYSSISPVNTFRLILDGYFDVEMELIDDRIYYTSWERPYDYIEISDLREDLCGP